jgi:putative hemolysin
MLEGVLDCLQVRCEVASADLAHVPQRGPTVVVANHPFGVLEAVALVTVLRGIRPDVCVLANELVCSIPELSGVLIPVDVLRGSRRANASGIRRAIEFVRGGGLLLVFPAGAVSHFHWRERAAVDPPWHPEIARLIRLCAKRTEISIVPAFIPGSNSLLFQAAGQVHSALRTALLARELFNKKHRVIEVRVGHSIGSEKLAGLPGDRDRIEYLRWRTYLLACRGKFRANTRKPLHRSVAGPQTAVIGPPPPEMLAAEVEALPPRCVLDRSGDLRVFLATAAEIPLTLREIGRLREITFRQAGEGTGQATDLDRFDAGYLHLFLWNATRREIAGAYRLSPADRAEDLYTQTLFQFDQRFLRAMGPAVELGRSFIRAEYQKGFAPLLLLWKGIGKFIAANPQYKTLFGPVSISNQYQPLSRELMIAFLTKHASLSDWMDMVRPRHPKAAAAASRCDDVQELSNVVRDIEPARAGIPVLLRQYLKLGGKLLGFSVDPEFSNALDGLIVVDLTRTEPKLLERYLGKAEATVFLNFHKEPTHGIQ